MPQETQAAVEWALQQEGVTLEHPHTLVDAVRRYFNEHNIEYQTFSFEDMLPFLPQ